MERGDRKRGRPRQAVGKGRGEQGKKNEEGERAKRLGVQLIYEDTQGTVRLWAEAERRTEPYASQCCLRKDARGWLDGSALVPHTRGSLSVAQVYGHRATILLGLLLKSTSRVTVDNILLDFLVTKPRHPPV